jgi:hypothetical protein
MAKLTEVQIGEIRHLSDAGSSRAELARKYGVTDVLISLIARRKIWVHVPEAPVT